MKSKVHNKCIGRAPLTSKDREGSNLHHSSTQTDGVVPKNERNIRFILFRENLLLLVLSIKTIAIVIKFSTFGAVSMDDTKEVMPRSKIATLDDQMFDPNSR